MPKRRKNSAEISVEGGNSKEQYERQRFTIAHEIGHLLLHDGDELHVDSYQVFRVNLRNARSSDATDWREIEANTFAAALLMPEDFVRREFTRTVEQGTDVVDGDWLSDLAKRFEVSVQAFTIRLNHLGLLDEVQF